MSSQSDGVAILLTRDLPGIGGLIKVNLEDFVVEEVPLYAPGGIGEHTYFQIEKRGISTFRAVSEIARALGVGPQQIGYAGLKDAHAVTRQVLSVERVEPDALMRLALPSIRILWVKRHTNKLRRGHLAGNRFVIRVREVPESALQPCRAILHLLQRRGVPNYYGPQRFGRRGDTHELGRAIVHNDPLVFFRTFLGRPQPAENPAVQEARRLYDQGDWSAAQATWPAQFGDERNALRTLVQRKSQPQAYRVALGGIPKRMREFYVSAYQSYLFNRVVRARVDTLDRLFDGDVATKHDSGGSFIVENAQSEQPRADRFEISPSGPIFGYRMLLAQGTPGNLESQVLADEGLDLAQFKSLAGLKLKGERRPLRFPLEDVDSWYDDGVVVTFRLPPGSYATNVMAEITKAELAAIDE